ncbi:MAG TPA: hypothetical protein VGE46_09375, partial [Bdellovibrio sp.]
SYDHYVELLERKNKELNERIYFVGTEILGVKAYAEILKRPLDLEVVSLNDLEKTMKKKWVTFDHIETTAFYCPELGRISKEFAEVQGYKAFYYAEVDPGFKCNP